MSEKGKGGFAEYLRISDYFRANEVIEPDPDFEGYWLYKPGFSDTILAGIIGGVTTSNVAHVRRHMYGSVCTKPRPKHSKMQGVLPFPQSEVRLNDLETRVSRIERELGIERENND